jgi:hypothetical protein
VQAAKNSGVNLKPLEQFSLGELMPRYISLHTLACLTRQGAEQLTSRLAAADRVTMRRVQVNMIEGKMLVEFDSPDRDALEKWFRDEGFHYDWVLRVEFEARGTKLEPV